MGIFKKKTARVSAEDAALAERLSAIANRGKVDLPPVIIVPEPPTLRQAIPQLFWTPADLLAKSACE